MYSCGFVVKHHCTEAIWFQDDRPPSNQNVRHYRKGIIATVGVVIALVIVVGSIYLMQAGRSDLADMIECPDHIHEPYLDQVRDLESRYVAKLDTIMQIERDSGEHQGVLNYC